MKIYLAIPYSGNEEESFKKANQVAGQLMAKGHLVFSPISHTHPIAKECSLPSGYDYWEKYDITFIEWCEEVWVIKLGDWSLSKGVTSEIGIASNLGKRVVFIEP